MTIPCAKCAALSARVKELERDKARLDFMDADRAAMASGFGLRIQSWRDDIDENMRKAAIASGGHSDKTED